MPLSNMQSKLLQACEIDAELQEFLGLELGFEGQPKGKLAPDFLIILCNLLQISEHRLLVMRQRLGKIMAIEGSQGMIAEPPPDVATIEREIKHCWTRAVALWRATDHVVRHGEEFGVELHIRHVEYALTKNNLPVVEMIRYAKPEYFETEPVSTLSRYSAWAMGAIVGAFIGFYGGFKGGLREARRVSRKIRPFARIFYPIAGIFSGSAMGFMAGGQMGLRTGNLSAAYRLALDASYLNPFHEPLGTRHQQAVELRREEILFELSHSYFKKKESIPTLTF